MTKKTDAWMPLYVADYLADTSRLTTEQHGAYLLILMDYWRNGPPPDDDEVLCSITRMSLGQWRKARAALHKFFAITDGNWTQKRADIERQEASDISAKRADAGKQGASKRWGKRDGNSIANAIANAIAEASQTDAPSPTPKTKPPKPTVSSPLRPQDVGEQVWEDWVKHRKAKRATVSDTVLSEARKESAKAGMTLEAFLAVWCRRGTQGLEADWLKPNERTAANGHHTEPAWRTADRERNEAFLGPAAAKKRPITTIIAEATDAPALDLG